MFAFDVERWMLDVGCLLGFEGKMLAANHFGHPLKCTLSIHRPHSNIRTIVRV